MTISPTSSNATGSLRWRRFAPLAIAALALLAACSGGNTNKQQAAPPAAVVKSFSANPTALTHIGDTVTLSWTVENATGITLQQLGKGTLKDNVEATGTFQVELDAAAIFVLSARGLGGSDAAVTSVGLMTTQNGSLFDAVPKAIVAGQGTTLVWNVPGATGITITPMGGQPLDLGGQGAEGTVKVNPQSDTTYQLTGGNMPMSVDVKVGPAIYTFTHDVDPLPNQPVKLSWTTGGASQLVLTRSDLTDPVVTVTDPAQVVAGDYTDTVPNFPPDGIVRYTLTATSAAGAMVTSQQDVNIAGSAVIDSFTLPHFVKPPGNFTLQWTTHGATSLQLFADGVGIYAAPDQDSVNSGSMVFPDPATHQDYTLTIANSRSQTSQTVRVEAVGLPTFNSFSADQTELAQGGSPLTLSWDVTNARHVTITEVGRGVVVTQNGTLDTGTAVVYPNHPSVTYQFNADNGAGDSVPQQTATVVVDTLAVLTFDTTVPAGATAKVTGSTVPNGGAILGLPSVTKNAPGDAYVEISTSGSVVNSGYDSFSDVDTLSQTFNTIVFGRKVSLNKISVSPNGWFVFSANELDGQNSNSPTFGTALAPLAIAPFWTDLISGTAYVKFDNVAGDPRMILEWQNFENNQFNGNVTFEAQIFGSGKIVFAYADVTDATGLATIGVVNGSQTSAIYAPDQPKNGDTYTFFTGTTLPVQITVENAPYLARVQVGSGFCDVSGDAHLLVGQFGISEVNPRPPAAVTNGEWFEVTSQATQAIDLAGWTITTGGNSHVIAGPLSLPAGGRLVLAQATDLGDPSAGVTADYVYPATVAMADTSGSISLSLAGAAYTTATWDGTSVPDAGITARVDVPDPSEIFTSTNASLSCSGIALPAYGANGEHGSPGASQPHCFPYTLTAQSSQAFNSISDGGTVIVLGSATDSNTDDKEWTVALPTPIQYYGGPISSLYTGTNGWITTVSSTASSSSNRTTPANSAPKGSIAPFWDDLNANHSLAGGGMYYQQFDPDGTPGSGDEYTIVSWEHWTVYSYTMDLNFQVVFHANSDIEYRFGAMTGTTGGEKGSGATTWLEDLTGKAALKINTNSTTNPGISPNSAYLFHYSP